MPSLPDTSHTPFRLAEKHFKNRSVKGRLPTLHGQSVIDVSRPIHHEEDEVWQSGWWAPECSDVKRSRKGKERERGERPETDLSGLRRIRLLSGREAWVVADGCVLIPGYLSAGQQLNLLESALAKYTLPPNPVSIDTHYAVPPNLFDLYASSSAELIKPRCTSNSSTASRQGETRQTIETVPASVQGYEEIVAKNKTWQGDEPSDKLGAKTAEQLTREIRWANLGWVYQWSTKSYDFTLETPLLFPRDLAEVCSDVVRSIPWNKIFPDQVNSPIGDRRDGASWGEDYEPDTGIVNFYQLKSTLMGHVDRAELDPSRPLVSISLGHAAIFLLGSSCRLDPPMPIILRSGDVLIMSGRGRQSYHGVPRVMEGTLPSHFFPATSDLHTLAATKKWITTGRININARQVFPPGFQRPSPVG